MSDHNHQADDDDSDSLSSTDHEAPTRTSAMDAMMQLSEQEVEWALAIKHGIEADPELDSISDFMVAQLALIDHNDVGAAMERVQWFQGFREAYDIRDNFEDALVAVRDYMDLYENLILSFSYSKESQCYVSFTDLCAVKKLVTEQQWRTNLKGLFYMYQALNPEMQSIRNGCILVIECQGFEAQKSGGVDHFKRVASEFMGPYPCKHQAMKHYHSDLFSNVALSICRPFLPKELRDALEVGCIFEGRLDGIFLVPDAKQARKRNYFRIMDSLKARYESEKEFSLASLVLEREGNAG